MIQTLPFVAIGTRAKPLDSCDSRPYFTSSTLVGPTQMGLMPVGAIHPRLVQVGSLSNTFRCRSIAGPAVVTRVIEGRNLASEPLLVGGQILPVRGSRCSPVLLTNQQTGSRGPGSIWSEARQCRLSSSGQSAALVARRWSVRDTQVALGREIGRGTVPQGSDVAVSPMVSMPLSSPV